MRKGIAICSMLFLASLSLAAQGHRPPTNTNSNGQRGTDRDFGKDRAADAGKGKKEGLEADQGKKKGHTKKHHKGEKQGA